MKKPLVEIKATKDYYNKNAAVWAGRKTDSFYHEVPFSKGRWNRREAKPCSFQNCALK